MRASRSEIAVARAEVERLRRWIAVCEDGGFGEGVVCRKKLQEQLEDHINRYRRLVAGA